MWVVKALVVVFAFALLDSLGFFSNKDHPQPPVDYMPGKPYIVRNVAYWFRNPAHDFCFYTIGLKGKDFKVTNENRPGLDWYMGGWTWHTLSYKWLRLPYINYRNPKWEFYAGWRSSGAFGLKIRRHAT